jgi:GT2 family glycosyltransferase
MAPPASIVIPTRERLPYLEVALASIAEQARRSGTEVLVIDDGGPSDAARSLVEGFGARYEPHERPMGLNAARNTGVSRSNGELVVFLDDDVRACDGWLEALLEASRNHPAEEVLAGRIVARLEGSPPHSCGREQPPITTLELGGEDSRTRFAWGSNMAIRREALERVGPFNPQHEVGGDEQEWQERRETDGVGRGALYVAGARVEHRRSPEDARLRSLCRAAYGRGQAARRFDARRGQAGPARAELAVFGGCLAHVLRRRCPAGLAMAAHSAGRLRVALAANPQHGAPAVGTPPPSGGEDFLSGASGTVGGLDSVRRRLTDGLLDGAEIASGRRRRLARASVAAPPRRRVLALGVERPEHRVLAAAIRTELERSRHDVELHTTPPGGQGKFENLNRLLAEHPAEGHDWLLVLDDDVELPRGFLDRLLFLSERFSLTLAQPAHRLDSHAAWAVTRRRRGSVVRETSFVEIGPVTAFAQNSFELLLPFPELRMGWGLDLHWAAVAREQGWRSGVIDALAVGHRVAPAGAAYPREQAIAEARSFLRGRPYLRAPEAERTITTHGRW